MSLPWGHLPYRPASGLLPLVAYPLLRFSSWCRRTSPPLPPSGRPAETTRMGGLPPSPAASSVSVTRLPSSVSAPAFFSRVGHRGARLPPDGQPKPPGCPASPRRASLRPSFVFFGGPPRFSLVSRLLDHTILPALVPYFHEYLNSLFPAFPPLPLIFPDREKIPLFFFPPYLLALTLSTALPLSVDNLLITCG